ncbi:MAG: DMT family transporter [Lachnospiraceae bacterium]|nr:DMT family transporter [Lachnospiraceae bacterium]
MGVKMKKIGIKQIILLQAIIIIYTVSSIMAKFASAGDTLERIVLFFGLDLLFLGIYAICWQQMIKIFPLSVAYANRAMALLWSAIWAKIIFGEQISVKQMVGIALVIVGTLIINTETQEKPEHE